MMAKPKPTAAIIEFSHFDYEIPHSGDTPRTTSTDLYISYLKSKKMASQNVQKNLIALVTGANQGIGLQVSRELVARGYTVL